MLSSCVMLALMLAAPMDDAKVDGTFKVVAMEVDGNKVPDDEVKKFEIVIKDGTYEVKNDGQPLDKGKLAVNAKAKPKTMDAKSESGQTQGQTMQGIYVLMEGGFKVCFAPFGKPRPKELSSKSGSGHILITYKKAG